LRGDHRRFGRRDTAAIGHLVGAAQIAPGGGELRIDGIADIGLDLSELRGKRVSIGAQI